MAGDRAPAFIVDSSKREHAEAYDEASDIYDTYEGLFFPHLFGRIDELLRDRFIPLLPEGARVLDIGCGTGHLIFPHYFLFVQISFG